MTAATSDPLAEEVDPAVNVDISVSTWDRTSATPEATAAVHQGHQLHAPHMSMTACYYLHNRDPRVQSMDNVEDSSFILDTPPSTNTIHTQPPVLPYCYQTQL